MKKVLLIVSCVFVTVSLYAQKEEKNGYGAKLTESNFHLGVDLQTKYVWRGMEMMTEEAAPVLFPSFNYSNKGFFAYVMGGYSINGKYAEVDFGLSYSYKWFTIAVNDYYYPTTTVATDQYFNFKNAQTGHWLEAAITIAPEKIPVYLTVSSFLYGADKNMEGKQAYSTYAELGTHYDFLNDHQLAFTMGAALNSSCYNGYAHGFSVCSIELKYTYNLAIKDFTLPLSVAYIINPIYEKSFVNLMASFAF